VWQVGNMMVARDFAPRFEFALLLRLFAPLEYLPEASSKAFPGRNLRTLRAAEKARTVHIF